MPWRVRSMTFCGGWTLFLRSTPGLRMRSWATTNTGCHADGGRHFRPAGNLSCEPERKPFLEPIFQAETRMISAANVLEPVLCWRPGVANLRVGNSISSWCGQSTDCPRRWRTSRDCTVRVAEIFGKGRHSAALNFGDCFATLWLRPRANRCWRKAMICSDGRRTVRFGRATERVGRDLCPPHTSKSLLFLFLHIPACGFGFLHDLVLQHAGYGVVVMHFHVEAAAALRH